MQNLINWFEIPAKDLKRATSFYKQILNIDIQEVEMMGTKMGFMPSNGENVTGAIVEGEHYAPATTGSLLYLNGGNDLQHILSKVEAAGGTVLVPKTQISPEAGYFAMFLDTENNRLGLHSMN